MTKTWKLILFLLFVQLSVAISQTRTITGNVYSLHDEEPLPGVNVVIEGTNTGTITDLNGHFILEVPEETEMLTVSFVGMVTEQVNVANQNEVDVYLVPNIESLEEVVVIGYGSTSKKLLTSSISTVNEKELENAISTGIESAIQGKTAGVQVIQNSGTPGAALTMNIRGKSSISAGTQPLYVIDGIPVTTGNYGQIGFEGQTVDASLDINPNNIESISILKDASAAAIYGARAANGVVLITTKTGTGEKAKINFNAYTGLQKEWRRLDMLNAEEWREFASEIDPGFVESLNTNINTDWQDEVFRVAPISNYELSVSGGNEKTRYFVSGRYFDQEGIVIGSDYQKLNGRSNINFQVNDKISLAAKLGVTSALNNRIIGDQTINGVLPNAISKPPVYAVRDSLGNYLEQGFWDNPVAIGNEVTNEFETFRSISSVEANIQLLKPLTFFTQWGVDVLNIDERRYEPTTVRRGAQSDGIGVSAKTDVRKIIQQSTLNYVNEFFDNHKINLLAGYSFEQIKERSNYISGVNFPSNDLEYLVSAATIETADSDGLDSGLSSFFGRFIYNFRDKYIATFNFRYDGSSNFGENNQYAAFPGVSVAWRIKEEPLLQNFNRLSDLKLRLSYGLTGNDNIGAFKSRNLYSSGYNYNGTPGIIPTQIPNPDLRWETTSTFNAGVNIAFFNNRLDFTVDYYQNHTKDLLLNRPLPPTTGFSFISANVGELENKGVEVVMNSDNIQGAFTWSTSINVSANRNNILELYNDQPITNEGRGNNAAIVGEPLGVFFMHNSLGVDPSTGDILLEDIDDSGDITDADRMVVGDPNPDFTGGIANTFGFKGIDLNVFFQFSYGNDVFNGTRQYAEAMSFGTSDNQLSTIKQRWREPGDITFVPRINGENNLFPISSHYLEDGSFLRLKELTLGYNFSQNLMNRIGFMQSARIFVKGQNLITITPYSGMDPEVNYSGPGSIRQGTDFFTYPNPRTVIAGINLSF